MGNKFEFLSDIEEGHSYSGKITEEMTLQEKLRQYAKWYNLSNPAVCKLLLDAADEIDKLEKENSEMKNELGWDNN